MNAHSKTAHAGKRRAVVALALASALILPGMLAHAESYANPIDIADDAEMESVNGVDAPIVVNSSGSP